MRNELPNQSSLPVGACALAVEGVSLQMIIARLLLKLEGDAGSDIAGRAVTERLLLFLVLVLLVVLGGSNGGHPDRGEGSTDDTLDRFAAAGRTREPGHEFIELF
jgi:hypothetical protein